MGELINFQAKNRIFYVLLRVNSRSRDLGSPNLARITHSLIFMLSPNFNFLGFTVASYEHINPHLPNSRKNKRTTRLRKVSISRFILSRHVEAEAVKFLCKRKHFDERDWKRKRTRKRLILSGAGSGSKKFQRSGSGSELGSIKLQEELEAESLKI